MHACYSIPLKLIISRGKISYLMCPCHAYTTKTVQIYIYIYNIYVHRAKLGRKKNLKSKKCLIELATETQRAHIQCKKYLYQQDLNCVYSYYVHRYKDCPTLSP